MRALRLCVFCLVVSFGVTSNAGHGFMNSFSETAWYPDAGITPDKFYYPFDCWLESLALWIARWRGEHQARAFVYAKEKLAEASMMIKAQNLDAAARALAIHRRYIDRARDDLAANEALQPRYDFINELLEQIYIVSIDYVDMPLEVRKIALDGFFVQSMDTFRTVREPLNKEDKAALFFKEEEIRWSLAQVEQADLQAITNYLEEGAEPALP